MKSCKTKKCGCIDTGLTTPTPCAHDTLECPTPDPCAETFSDCCVIHNGDGIAELNIQTGDRVCDIWQKIALAISAAGGDGVTIESVTVEGNDLIITMTDGTIFDTPLPAATVPNDPWVTLGQADMTAITFASSAINSLSNFALMYKIISSDTILIKGYLRLLVTIDAPEDTVDLNFRWPAFSGSNWFVGTKQLAGTFPRGPLKIINSTGLSLVSPNQMGTAFGAPLGLLNLISVGETRLQLPNGNYTIDLHFEFTSPLQ